MKNTKPYKIIMLPQDRNVSQEGTNDIGDLCLFSYGLAIAGKSDLGYPAQHLYIISDDEIKEWDWFYSDEYAKPEQARIFKGNLVNGFIKSACKKIVCSTDKTITPNSWIPESFLSDYAKAYNENKPIVEVELEMTEEMSEGWTPSYGNPDNNNFDVPSEPTGDIIPKTMPDGSIILADKIYSTQEVIKILNAYREFVWRNGATTHDLNKWIEENILKQL